jgi:hypothetical protein
MEAALVPCVFAIVHAYQNRNYMCTKVTDSIVQAVLFASVVATLGTGVSPPLAWGIVMPPVVVYAFFVVYQRLRAKRVEATTVRVAV